MTSTGLYSEGWTIGARAGFGVYNGGPDENSSWDAGAGSSPTPFGEYATSLGGEGAWAYTIPYGAFIRRQLFGLGRIFSTSLELGVNASFQGYTVKIDDSYTGVRFTTIEIPLLLSVLIGPPKVGGLRLFGGVHFTILADGFAYFDQSSSQPDDGATALVLGGGNPPEAEIINNYLGYVVGLGFEYHIGRLVLGLDGYIQGNFEPFHTTNSVYEPLPSINNGLSSAIGGAMIAMISLGFKF